MKNKMACPKGTPTVNPSIRKRTSDTYALGMVDKSRRILRETPLRASPGLHGSPAQRHTG